VPVFTLPLANNYQQTPISLHVVFIVIVHELSGSYGLRSYMYQYIVRLWHKPALYTEHRGTNARLYL